VEDEEAGTGQSTAVRSQRGNAGASLRPGALGSVWVAVQVVTVGAVLVLFTTGILYGAQRLWLEPQMNAAHGKLDTAAEAQLRSALDVNATVVENARQAVLFTPSAWVSTPSEWCGTIYLIYIDGGWFLTEIFDEEHTKTPWLTLSTRD
jgi:hypothetical protein